MCTRLTLWLVGDPPPHPMLVKKTPRGPGGLPELKLDGYRIGMGIENGRGQLLSRRGNDWTAQFPEVARAAKKLRVRSAVLDGEVVALDEAGISSFQALQNRSSRAVAVTYFAFDLLELDGRDVSREPLVDRKAR